MGPRARSKGSSVARIAFLERIVILRKNKNSGVKKK
jgi:hypothetical protein